MSPAVANKCARSIVCAAPSNGMPAAWISLRGTATDAATSRARVASIRTSAQVAMTQTAATACASLIHDVANCSGTCSACSTRTPSAKSAALAAHSSHAHAACRVASQVALMQAAAHSSAVSIQPAARARGMKPVQRTRRISAIDHRIAPTAATRSLSILNLAAPMSSAAPLFAKSNPSAANSVGTQTASTSRKASATPSQVALAAASAAFRTHRLVAMTPPVATSSADSIQCAVLRDGM